MPPSVQALPALLSRLRAFLPPSLPKSVSYILPASALTALGHPNLLGPLFLQVTGHSDSLASKSAPAATASPEEARTVSLHLRDMLLKEWTLIGIPLVITAVASLGTAEKQAGLFPPDASTFDNSKWDIGGTRLETAHVLGSESTVSSRYTSNLDLSPRTPISTRGAIHLQRLYRHHLPSIMKTWGSHEADFRWLEESLIYGLFLSDHSALSDVETSLVTTSGIMAQGLKAPTLWHLRGLRRLGVSKGDVEAVVRCVGECAVWAGGKVRGPTGETEEVEEWVRWVSEVEGEI